MHIIEIRMVYTGLGAVFLLFTIVTELQQLTLGPSLLYFKYYNRPSRIARAQSSVSGVGTRNGTE